MNFIFVGKSTVVSESLKEKVEEKLGKLENFIEDNAQVKVSFSVIKNDNIVEITLPIGKRTLRSESKASNMYDAIDDVCHKLERQVKKYKSRLRSKSNKNKLFVEELDKVSLVESDYEVEDNLIKIKKFSLKPMTAEEAIMEMELINHKFFVFKDADDSQIKVVYSRFDGNYGLIQEK